MHKKSCLFGSYDSPDQPEKRKRRTTCRQKAGKKQLEKKQTQAALLWTSRPLFFSRGTLLLAGAREVLTRRSLPPPVGVSTLVVVGSHRPGRVNAVQCPCADSLVLIICNVACIGRTSPTDIRNLIHSLRTVNPDGSIIADASKGEPHRSLQLVSAMHHTASIVADATFLASPLATTLATDLASIYATALAATATTALIATDATALVATNATALVTTDATALVSMDGITLTATDATAVVVTNATALAATDATALVATDGIALTATDATALVATNATALAATDGIALAIIDATTLVATDATSLDATTAAALAATDATVLAAGGTDMMGGTGFDALAGTRAVTGPNSTVHFSGEMGCSGVCWMSSTSESNSSSESSGNSGLSASRSRSSLAGVDSGLADGCINSGLNGAVHRALHISERSRMSGSGLSRGAPAEGSGLRRGFAGDYKGALNDSLSNGLADGESDGVPDGCNSHQDGLLSGCRPSAHQRVGNSVLHGNQTRVPANDAAYLPTTCTVGPIRNGADAGPTSYSFSPIHTATDACTNSITTEGSVPVVAAAGCVISSCSVGGSGLFRGCLPTAVGARAIAPVAIRLDAFVEEGTHAAMVGFFAQALAHLDAQVDHGAQQAHLHDEVVLAEVH